MSFANGAIIRFKLFITGVGGWDAGLRRIFGCETN
jgi:hypothetical protein